MKLLTELPNLEIHRNPEILNQYCLGQNDPGSGKYPLICKKIHDKRLFVMRTEKVRLFLYK